MVYDSLLLRCGGGITPESVKAPQYSKNASLVIGIGGTGVAALSTLRGKMRRQLRPDVPEEATARYEGIQLLGIDSEDGERKQYRGDCRLTDSEFFSIENDYLPTILKVKKPVKADPMLNWMDIDNIDLVGSTRGAGGVRQAGRYLLMSKAADLEATLQEKCRRAMQCRQTSVLDIYVFAGLSGGTGSGCFLDVCYMLRRIAENNAWNVKILGYFFLPDAVISQPQLAHNPQAISYNSANGYAALKELDYLSNLYDANDWFSQTYSSTLRVHTQEPPVDLCHLVSACRANGTLLPNGYAYSINVVTDYVMSYLADVRTDSWEDSHGKTLRGHHANLSQSVFNLPRNHGATMCYHIIGAANAEMPTTQMLTYLSCHFFDWLCQQMQATQKDLEQAVQNASARMLTFEDLHNALKQDMPALLLPLIDKEYFADAVRPGKGYLPEKWASAVNEWLDRCMTLMTVNRKQLTGESTSSRGSKSLIAFFRRYLQGVSADVFSGPYYAASLLQPNALFAQVDRIIAQCEAGLADAKEELQKADQALEQAKDAVYGSLPRKTAYAAFEQALIDRCSAILVMNTNKECIRVLRTFREQLKQLNETFYQPLTAVLHNLEETFRENSSSLELPVSNDGYTIPIIDFRDIRSTLDEQLHHFDLQAAGQQFLKALVQNSDAWVDGDPDKIATLICKQMSALFRKEMDKRLTDHLKQRFPMARDPDSLADEIRTQLISSVYEAALPMFWKDSNYNIDSFISCQMNVPADERIVCTAADAFFGMNHMFNYSIRESGIQNRIFALRLYSGIPLYAYQGLTAMKQHYEKKSMPGIHLYAFTGRGSDGSGHKDWRSFLPEPIPYSIDPALFPNGEELVALYEAAKEAGILTFAQGKYGPYYALRITKPFEKRTYSTKDFTENGRFRMAAYNEELAQLTAIQETFFDDCQHLPLRDDGNHALPDIAERCRLDYFVRYPLLQKAVREELDKCRGLEDSVNSLKQLLEEYEAYERDLTAFCDLLFCGFLAHPVNAASSRADNTAVVFCRFRNSYDEQVEYLFSSRLMPFGKTFPLYQAFLTFHKLHVYSSLRKDLAEALEAVHAQPQSPDDHCIAWDLAAHWSTFALEHLEQELAAAAPEQVWPIREFYTGLLHKLERWQEDAPVWPDAAMRQQLTPQIRYQPSTPNRCCFLLNPADNKILVLYPAHSLEYVYDLETSTAYPVTQDMQAWSKEGWICLDDCDDLYL